MKILYSSNNNMNNDTGIFENEMFSLCQMAPHINIIQIYECGVATYKKIRSGKCKDIYFIAFEYAEGGQLCQFLNIGGRFSEPIARYFFKELIAGIDHCHRNGVCHRDLKPDNLMLDEEFNLKIVDFGFASPIQGGQGDGKCRTILGTHNFKAPEIILKKEYSGKNVDIFASAVCLF